MSVTKIPSGRWRAQVYDPATGKNVSVSKVLGGPGTFRTKTEAKDARSAARAKLGTVAAEKVTVRQWRDRWITDPLFARPKQSTNKHNAERTKAFSEKYGDVPINDVSDFIVNQWLTGGTRNGTIPALRAMFDDAASARGGRLVERNPFAGLGVSRGPGNRHKAPPTEAEVWAMIQHARDLSGPSFAAWLQVAAFTGMRPGELDALRWTSVDLEAGRITVSEQYSAASKTFTTPKNGQTRRAPLTPPARDALIGLPRDGEFCFASLRGTHWTSASRAYHWKAVRAAAGLTDKTLYLCTRHFAGWYMVNVLDLPSEDVAIALGHTDGGDLVRRLYGHRDTDMALDRVASAYAKAGTVKPLRVVRQGVG
jgi:integrase